MYNSGVPVHNHNHNSYESSVIHMNYDLIVLEQNLLLYYC